MRKFQALVFLSSFLTFSNLANAWPNLDELDGIPPGVVATFPIFNVKPVSLLELNDDGILSVRAGGVDGIEVHSQDYSHYTVGNGHTLRANIAKNIKTVFYHHTPTYSGYFAVDKYGQLFKIQTGLITKDEVLMTAKIQPVLTPASRRTLYLDGPLSVTGDQTHLKLLTSNGATYELSEVLPSQELLQDKSWFKFPPATIKIGEETARIRKTFPLFLGDGKFATLSLADNGYINFKAYGFHHLSTDDMTASSGAPVVELSEGTNIRRIFYYSSAFHSDRRGAYFAVTKDNEILKLYTETRTSGDLSSLNKTEYGITIRWEPLIDPNLTKLYLNNKLSSSLNQEDVEVRNSLGYSHSLRYWLEYTKALKDCVPLLVGQ